MAKKHFGRFLTFAAIAGAAAAGISYFLQYKSFHKELDEDFHDFEDDFDEFEDTDDKDNAAVTRNYVSLTPERKSSEEEMSPESDETDGREKTGEAQEPAEDASENASADSSEDTASAEQQDTDPADKATLSEEEKTAAAPEADGKDESEEKKETIPDTTVTVEEMTE